MENYTKKSYQVIFTDENDIWWGLGTYANLKDAEPEVNDYLSRYVLAEDEDYAGETPAFGEGYNQGALSEEAGTFGPVFDRPCIMTEDGPVGVRGFVLYETDVAAICTDYAKKHIEEGYKLDKEACDAGMTPTGRMLACESAREIAIGETLEKLAKILSTKDISPEEALKILEAEPEEEE